VLAQPFVPCVNTGLAPPAVATAPQARFTAPPAWYQSPGVAWHWLQVRVASGAIAELPEAGTECFACEPESGRAVVRRVARGGRGRVSVPAASAAAAPTVP
jgi:hypothetical protein